MPPGPIIIVNPASAGGATGKAWPKIASAFRRHYGPFECRFTASPGDALSMAADEARSGRKFIIACGGDGTANEVANGILRSGADAELGILPAGTGGDFRRTLKIPASPAAAARALRDGKWRLIDVGELTYQRRDGLQESRYFLGVASFGLSGEVIRRVKEGSASGLPRAGALGGMAAFALATLQTTFATGARTVVVQIDEAPEHRLDVLNLCIANARYFGGGMKIAPSAELDDGRLDIVVIGDLGRLKVLAHAPRLYTGTHLGIDQVTHLRALSLTARAASPGEEIGIEIDGELLGRLPIEAAIRPGSLRVRCPQD